jgi:glycerol-3-phosphate dehydrogenase (NAD(P)+)
VTRVAVLGAGSWGTTLADLLVKKGASVTLWAFEPPVATAINETHENSVYLSGCQLAPGLEATSDPAAAVRDAEVIVSASPSHVVRAVLSSIAGSAAERALVVSATKGIETDTLEFMSDVCRTVLPGRPFVALSGPSFAREVFAGQPTAVVAASESAEAARAAQQLFATPTFRVYSNADVVGTQLAGALKNVIAIAAGILEGLGMGHNPRAALITRGLAEMTRLGAALGADPRTFAGLAGMGDLILTSCGALSRNRTLGIAIGSGTSLDDHQGNHRTVAEGVNTAQAAVRLAARHQIELPIVAKVAEILFDRKPPRQAIADLMERTLKPEQ